MDSNVCDVPLVVDLDGSLLKTDLLAESSNEFITAHPCNIFIWLFWALQGKCLLKSRLALVSNVDPATLPYNKKLLAWIKHERSNGRRLVLATATHKLLAEKIADYLGLFVDVLATDGDINLKSDAKRDKLISLYGDRCFDYVGNSSADLPVWASARKAYVVSTSARFINRVNALGNLHTSFSSVENSLGMSILKAIRPYQWIKNILVFVPLLAAHRFNEPSDLLNSLIAFFVLCITASSVYILNDLNDVSDDRYHQRKRYRPFAAGNLNLLFGWALWPILLILAYSIASVFLPFQFLVIVIIYTLLTLAYSFGLKKRAMVDVLTLAGLYTIRVVAGAAAISVPLSFWLLTFSMFLFLSLAFVKRFSELKNARRDGYAGVIRGRGYLHQDLELVSSMGAGAGYLSVLVLALYIQDAHTARLYVSPEVIWLTCPLLLFWISRTWLIAHRGMMHDDPIVFAIKDPTSWVIGGCFIGLFGLAMVV